MFKFAHDVDSAEERFALALREFSKLALAPRRVPPHGPQLDARQLELIALAHRALWFGVELRLGDRERTARGFAAAEMLHGEARVALRREIAYAREMHVLALTQDIELGPEPLERSEQRLAEVARLWRESAYELGLATFARWLGEPSVLRELTELYGDLLRVVRVTTLPLRADGPDPAYLRSLLTLARAGESGAAPRGAGTRDLSPELREEFRQDATRTAKLSALIGREEAAGKASTRASLRARSEAIARSSDSLPPESKLSVLSIDRAPPSAARRAEPARESARPGQVSSELELAGESLAKLADSILAESATELADKTPPPSELANAQAAAQPVTPSMAVSAMFGAQRGATSLFRLGIALAALGLLAVLAIALMPTTFWWGSPIIPTPNTSSATSP